MTQKGPKMPESDVERPQATDRECTICGAEVAAWDKVMCCHCYEIPWKRLSPPSGDRVRGEVFRHLDERIENYRALMDDSVEAGRDGGPYPIVVEALQMIREHLASLPHEAPAEVGEWVTVPREPTEAMGTAGAHAQTYIEASGKTYPQLAASVWSAMLAAAPSSPQDARIAELEAENARLREGLRLILSDVDDLIGDSDGVYGLHRNGDPSPWSELIDGGRFEGWLSHRELARSLLSTTKGEGRDANPS